MNRDAVKQALIRDEGVRLMPYRDSVGVLTIGIGRNLDANGISRLEALHLLDNDIARSESECKRQFAPWFSELDSVRQDVLVQMCFNLGISKLVGFINTLKAVERGDYSAAAAGMRGSKWARQVGARAERMAVQMETGAE